jgi:hypothetical protein
MTKCRSLTEYGAASAHLDNLVYKNVHTQTFWQAQTATSHHKRCRRDATSPARRSHKEKVGHTCCEQRYIAAALIQRSGPLKVINEEL